MYLALGFRLKHRDDLRMELHQFFLYKNTSAAQKVLNAHVDKHHVIFGSGSAPTLADAAYLTALYGVTFPETLAMAESAHACLRVVLDTFLGRYHPSAQEMDTVVLVMVEQET